MIKLKKLIKESAWDRKFGEPLPTLEDVMAEADVMDKTIKYKDKDGNEKEATVGGILKKGEDHPAYDDAKQMADKGGEEEPKSKGLGKGDFERDFTGDDEFALSGTDTDDPAGGRGDTWMHGDEEPSGEPEGDEEAAKAQAFKDMEDEKEESITINGKKYKEVKEEKKVTEKHILREMYEKIGGK